MSTAISNLSKSILDSMTCEPTATDSGPNGTIMSWSEKIVRSRLIYACFERKLPQSREKRSLPPHPGTRYQNPSAIESDSFEPLPEKCEFPSIVVRVGSCAAGTTVPRGAGARYPTRPAHLPTRPFLTPRWQGAPYRSKNLSNQSEIIPMAPGLLNSGAKTTWLACNCIKNRRVRSAEDLWEL